MGREKIKRAVIVIAAVLIALLCVKEYVDMKYYYINEKIITEFMSGTQGEKLKARRAIIKNVLTHIKYDINESRGGFSKANELDAYEKMNIAVFKVNVKDKDDLLFALEVNENLSYIGVYTKTGKKYTFLAKIDSFADIEEVQPIKLEGEGRDLIAVRERIPFTLSTCEESTYIKIYYFDKNRFNIALEILERYSWHYNENWDYPRLTESNWQAVTQKADVLWQNEYNPIITVKLWQTYGVSDEINAEEIPSEYSIIAMRDFTDEYNWSKKYNSFILYEGMDTKTGKKLAIIEDLEQSPYMLASGFVTESNYYRVKYENGKIEKLEKDRVSVIRKQG